QLFPKRKQTPATLPDELVSRHYTFLEYNQDHNQIVGPVKTPGIVLASLVYGVPVDKDISVCIDGELKPKQLEFIATVLEDVVGPGNIHIYKGGNLDRRIMLVSMAHHTASWLAGKPADIRSGNPRKKVILAELIEKYC
ncbi:MAG: hypothetical protein KJ922_02670, partial [Nanoarchaeota archaeon]|nr:hypothetical protein [Nanoarchaeota archaeon]